jgi:hypothetical protein
VSLTSAFSQDLAPRAFTIAPIHSNAITIAGAHATGSLLLDAVLPIPDSSGDSWASSVTYYHSMNFFGRYSNATVTLPYSVSDVRGTLNGIETTSHLSGLLGLDLRFSVNLLGGPAMDVAHFRKWKQKTVLGTSVVVITPTGQYDPTKLVNLGSNRWSFRPELGYSRRVANWVFDLYGGAWLFTTNHDYFSRNQYFPGTNVQTQTRWAPFRDISATTSTRAFPGCGFRSMGISGSGAKPASTAYRTPTPRLRIPVSDFRFQFLSQRPCTSL